MLMPVRCFSCGKPVAQDWEEYAERTGKGEDAAKVLDALGQKRYCCRRMFISHVDVLDDVMKHKRF